jgi:VWFA-related protein
VFGAGVTVVTLPVFVTDKDGKPISGLTAADFQVQDEGKSVKILGVEEIDAGAPLPAFRAVGPRGALAARRQFLLLFDLSFTNVAGLVRSRDGAKRFVREQLLDNDLAAVATFSVGAGVRMLVGFTPDRFQLEAAIDDLGTVKQERRSDPLGLVYDLRATGPQVAAPENRIEMTEELMSQAIQLDRAQEGDYKRRVEVLMKSMVQLGQALDAIQGRKQVIYLSAGFDSSMLVGAQGKQGFTDSQAVIEGRLWDVSTERYGDSSVRDAMSGVFKALAGSDTVVHTIDVTGLATSVDASSEGDARVAVGAGRESLSWIAADTGGRFYKDMNDLATPLGEIVDATRRYYVLAFEPEALKGAGKFHKLKVQVKGRGQKVSHRTGYTESAPDVTAALDREQTAEAVAKGLSGGPIAIEALALPYRNAEGRISVPVVVAVDGKTLLDRGPGEALPLEVFGYAFDEKGQVQDIVALVSTLDLPKFGTKLRESGLLVQASFDLPPGRHNLRFVVRDGEKQRRGFHALDVTVPAFTERLLYPPLFMDDPARWLVVQASSRSGAPVETPLRVGEDAFTPRMNASLTNGRSDSVCVMTFDGGRSYDPGAQFQIGAQLINAEGNAVRIGKIALTKSVAETDGFRRFVLNVTPAEVPPGEYTFKVKLTDPGTGAVSEAIHPVRVE